MVLFPRDAHAVTVPFCGDQAGDSLYDADGSEDDALAPPFEPIDYCLGDAPDYWDREDE